MQEEELFEEIQTRQDITQTYLGISLTKFFMLIIIVILLGIYVGSILYGANSLEILFELQDYEMYLDTEVYRLKHENEELQKEYFELKEISAQ